MKKLWLIFVAIFVFSFAILGWVGVTEIFRQAPPIPREVVMTDGQVLIPAEEISNGQNVWQAMAAWRAARFGEQTYQSVSVGYWSARSSEFMQTDLMQTLRWLRMIGDSIFALGAISFVYFVLNLMWQRPAKKAAIVPTNTPAEVV